jgi:hypothetical protein
VENEDVKKNVESEQNMPAGKPKEKPASLIVKPTSGRIVLDLDDISNTNVPPEIADLTIQDWEALSKKEPSTLTDLERRQLELTNAMWADVMTELRKNLFTPELTTAITQIGQVAQKAIASMMPTIDAIGSLQRQIAAANEPLNKALAQITSAALITNTFFEEMRVTHTRLQIDIASLVRPAQVTKTQSIEFDSHQVSEKNGHILTQSSANQIQVIEGLGDFVLIRRADLELLLKDTNADRATVAKFQHLLQPGAILTSDIQEIQFADITFRQDELILRIKNYSIPFTKTSSKQIKFLETLFRSKENFLRRWDVEELADEAFGIDLWSGATSEEDITKMFQI